MGDRTAWCDSGSLCDPMDAGDSRKALFCGQKVLEHVFAEFSDLCGGACNPWVYSGACLLVSGTKAGSAKGNADHRSLYNSLGVWVRRAGSARRNRGAGDGADTAADACHGQGIRRRVRNAAQADYHSRGRSRIPAVGQAPKTAQKFIGQPKASRGILQKAYMSAQRRLFGNP